MCIFKVLLKVVGHSKYSADTRVCSIGTVQESVNSVVDLLLMLKGLYLYEDDLGVSSWP